MMASAESVEDCNGDCGAGSGTDESNCDDNYSIAG